LFPFLEIKPQGSRKDPPLPAFFKNIGKILIQKVFSKSNSSFTAPRAWPQYPLGDEERWPEGGSINYNTILQLDMFCKKEGKSTEVPYVQLFFFLRDHPGWLKKCRIDTQTMVTLCKKPPNSLEQKKKQPSNAPSAPPFPLTQLPHTPDIIPQDSNTSS
jgi:hypothetical protein